MSVPDPERSVLIVEGKDDEHAILHLLRRHDLGYGQADPPPPLPIPRASEGGKDNLLAVVSTFVRSSTGRSAGFVLDANSRPTDRWKSIASHLGEVGVDAPDRIPADGFVGQSHEYKTRVGVWLMPDNQQTGALENFLASLVGTGDRLLTHARDSTDRATKLGAKFAPKDTPKAVVHAWLAWHEKPGLPYGTAVRAKYFRHDAPAATAFVAWFRRLYDVA